MKKAFQVTVELNHHSVAEMADEIRNLTRTIIDPDGTVTPIPDIRSGLLKPRVYARTPKQDNDKSRG